MNYRHGFHAGNHADVLKHVALLALCEALTTKPAPLFALDTHAGRGLYALDGEQAQRTHEADGGVGRLARGLDPAIDVYLDAIAACRAAHGDTAYPGSPWLLAHALREEDRIAVCELNPEEAEALKQNFARDRRVIAHARDGYAAMKALLPPKDGATRLNRGLVLIDPPYEAQLAEFDAVLHALNDAATRWPQGVYALWYPIKQARTLARFYRRATSVPAKSALRIELQVRPDDSPLRMNGSGLVIWNAPWQFDKALAPTLKSLARTLGEEGQGEARIDWLRAPA
ncbi:23S rRNA (adenine(2030)-N(6))-methyltransferase RlmJ [Solilutibacter tolerans]|uniref:Ribosomal RNA large subunit methyltransferase J n=1 Tax=Solilutibacter tolerans TaxID=1604334 RepID=A0A1N6VB29_9GAMM|nr:23S rRNA (adenine(2030)-N(6))-methyltransferase RlmJ [Lysobacter tolerans]SIQ75055.1 23S rRNA (adenine2030-N6)-methyltransferase [Lysobacter tolerans]